MGQSGHPLRHPPEPAPGDRLESWKEIAVYLKKGVRTVQRWEREEGLPVHRHLHDKLGTVYAYKAQLDAWWQNGHSRLEQEERAPAALGPRLKWAALAGVTAVALVYGAWWGMRRMGPPELPFQERDWVLVGNFENRTGEPAFDGVLDYALERELSNSRFVNVVSRQRVEDSLRLMQKPLEARVNLAVGREVCLRDGGIRALLTGRVEKLDSTYMLSVSLVEPASGRAVASFSEEAAGQKEVVSALRLLSNRIRETLGEKLVLIQQTEQNLEKVTTPSLRALQLYSRGMALVNEYKWEQAAQLLQLAVAEDPQFGSAHILLAHCYSNDGKYSEATPHYQRAYALASTTPDRERYFILGSYYDRFLGDREKAVQAYGILVALYPDHYWGNTNLGGAYYLLGRTQEAARYEVRRADLRPKDFDANYTAWGALVTWERDPARAKRYLSRAKELLTPEVKQLHTNQAVELEFLPIREHLWQENPGQALNESERLARTFDSLTGYYRDGFAAAQGDFYFTIGKLRAAEVWFQRISEPGWKHMGLSQIAEIRSDRKQSEYHLRKQIASAKYLGSGTAARLARVGLFPEAQRVIFQAEKRGTLLGYLEHARGELALARGQTANAITELRNAVAQFRKMGDCHLFMAMQSLARALEQHGDVPAAIQVLESLRDEPLVAACWPEPLAQFHLAQLYQKTGKGQQAREIEEKLLKFLAYADADHPILIRLQATQARKLAEVRD